MENVVDENIEPQKAVRKPIKVSDIFDDSDDDIFSSKPAKKAQKDNSKSHKENTDSLIQPKSKKDEEVKNQKTISDPPDIFSVPKQKHTDPLNEFNASLSGTDPPIPKTSAKEETTSKDTIKSFDASKKTDIFNDDSDDIFSTSKIVSNTSKKKSDTPTENTNKKKIKNEKTSAEEETTSTATIESLDASKKTNIFNDDSDDIFGTSKIFSNTSKKKSDTPTEDTNKKKIENENVGIEDVLFGSSPVKPTKAKETKKVCVIMNTLSHILFVTSK